MKFYNRLTQEGRYYISVKNNRNIKSLNFRQKEYVIILFEKSCFSVF